MEIKTYNGTFPTPNGQGRKPTEETLQITDAMHAAKTDKGMRLLEVPPGTARERLVAKLRSIAVREGLGLNIRTTAQGIIFRVHPKSAKRAKAPAKAKAVSKG